MRYFLELSFDGTAYHGWQVQKNARGVQEVLTGALSTLLRFPAELTGAGRTDTGVHAEQMYCHFDTEFPIKENSDLIYHLNALLPHDVAVNQLIPVNEKAHARYDAISRTYHYRMHIKKDVFKINKSWFYPHSLKFDLMNEACIRLMDFEDFGCFSKSRTQTKTNLCKVMESVWTISDGEIQFHIRADRFLRNMVRAIVGTMIEIGRGDMDLKSFEEVILSGKRSQAGISVPAHGLYLSAVEYPESIFKI